MRWLLLLLAGCGAIYVGYLDFVVQQKFAGKRWALPARVYARPLEIYVGVNSSQPQLVATLLAQGYRRGDMPAGPGSFAASATRVELHSRGFQFADGVEPARRAMVDFGLGSSGQPNHLTRVQKITDSGSGAPLDLLRLEPLLIGSFYPHSNEDRLLVPIDQVPKALIDALIVMEDRDFYQHHGVSPKAIARAIWADIRALKAVQGGSTLTQQLVKNFYLTAERSLSRKLNEAVMALLLELHFSKDEILEAYINEVFLGQAGRRAVHGFAQGSQLFFGRPLNELSTDQLALLAGMVKAPTGYHPRKRPQRAKSRRNLVLKVMADQGVLELGELKRLQARPLGVVDKTGVGLSRYPAFLDLVRRQLRRDYPDQVLLSEGLRIFATLDPVVQEVTEQVLQARLQQQADRTGHGDQLQGAMVVAEVANSEILALVGGRNPRNNNFNRALDASRSIGSLVKPAVYLSALSQPARYHLSTTLLDQPIRLDRVGEQPWQPQNYDRKFRGEVSLLDSLLRSLNVPTVRLGLDLGLPEVVETLRQLGLTRPINQQPALLLGAIGMSPLELNQLYLTIAAGGFYTPQRAILSVTDVDGKTLNRYPLQLEQRLDPAAVQLLQLALQEVGRRGTARGLKRYIAPAVNIAAKTGTTDDGRDSWLAGFSGNLAAVTWVGRDDNQPADLLGSTAALPIWGEVMGQLPLLANDPGGAQLSWLQAEPGGAAIALPQGVSCRGGSGVPAVRGFEPAGMRPCEQSTGVHRGGLANPDRPKPVANPLKWLLDKIPWPYD
ncbi:MAG: penicillin-binding protein 1B [Immundisolibacteraceae bacterium]|nr:penicillin-binding protein 1B [Immundisolibacteraceae bacterium]